MPNLFDTGFYRTEELRAMGFGRVGDNVSIAKNCIIVGNLSNITIGNHVRIDAFCTLIATGPIMLGSRIHIAGYCHLSAGDGIEMEDFSGLSHGVKLYSRTDDYSGEWLTNPIVPSEFTGVIAGKITIGRHAIWGLTLLCYPMLPSVKVAPSARNPW